MTTQNGPTAASWSFLGNIFTNYVEFTSLILDSLTRQPRKNRVRTDAHAEPALETWNWNYARTWKIPDIIRNINYNLQALEQTVWTMDGPCTWPANIAWNIFSIVDLTHKHECDDEEEKVESEIDIETRKSDIFFFNCEFHKTS